MKQDIHCIPPQQGRGKRIAIIKTMWNAALVDQAVEECLRALKDSDVALHDIHVYSVPGAYELPRGAKKIIETNNVDAIICIGVLIKGETAHFEYISQAVSQGIMDLNIVHSVPVIYGVLNCFTEDQAQKRVTHGYDWGLSALAMTTITSS